MRFHCTFVFDQETYCFSAICWVLVCFVLIDHVRCSPCMLFQHCVKRKKQGIILKLFHCLFFFPIQKLFCTLIFFITQ